MKRIIAVIGILTIAGCCTYTAIDGTVSKSFSNCFKTAQDTICNPPATVVDMAKTAAPIIKIAIGMLVPGSAEYLAAIDAAAAVDSILNTGCVGITALNKLIDFLKSPTMQGAEVQMAAKKVQIMKGTVSIISPVPFVDWRNSVK